MNDCQRRSVSHITRDRGYSSLALFDPKKDFAMVVLFNRGPGPDSGIVERLGLHIGQRLTGRRAVKVE